MPIKGVLDSGESPWSVSGADLIVLRVTNLAAITNPGLLKNALNQFEILALIAECIPAMINYMQIIRAL